MNLTKAAITFRKVSSSREMVDALREIGHDLNRSDIAPMPPPRAPWPRTDKAETAPIPRPC
jgi:hypothetical protein